MTHLARSRALSLSALTLACCLGATTANAASPAVASPAAASAPAATPAVTSAVTPAPAAAPASAPALPALSGVKYRVTPAPPGTAVTMGVYEIAGPKDMLFGAVATYQRYFSGERRELISQIGELQGGQSRFAQDFALTLPTSAGQGTVRVHLGSTSAAPCAEHVQLVYSMSNDSVVAITGGDESLRTRLLKGARCALPRSENAPLASACSQRSACLNQHLSQFKPKTFDGPILRSFSQLQFK